MHFMEKCRQPLNLENDQRYHKENSIFEQVILTKHALKDGLGTGML